ncbi:hypothetical protein CHLRE_10g422300v5 [Chlamydomonas reinhardtii]|uniref:thioredoxin-dependent peroxiredoxin n=1 Tax=Chlamydomonas reinhardtii TaxID=3055 RepID=A8ICK6_CHLRE|nr:uncharacterized protein CHLRE_10g422300v5 [Chlamydomonas reinhardtii]PNW77104.1 hypothetical protein CHLRE_10g422300v5 [Chlamydomonas reinhardtii]|eukprot:XP_001702592.1 thioredoxin dependent peroxidase [Chlamydomonas reinhardtii]
MQTIRAPARAPVASSRRVATFRAAPRVSRTPVVVVRAELKVGEKLEDYPNYYKVLKTSEGKTISLSSYKGKQPIVLFFYPKAATPGCTKEACRFRDEYSRFTAAGAVVFGISSDSPADNAAFGKANNLPYPLVTDENSILRKTFGIKGDFLGLLPGRQTYVIDVNGKCVMAFNDQLNVEQHVDEALKVLASVKVAA